MVKNGNEKNCVRCGRPVEVSRDCYEVFEKMHWLCFHLEFEHDGDPDRKCDDPSCPWWKIEVLSEKLRSLGCDPDEVFSKAIDKRWDL